MTTIDWKRKLSSRKFLASIVGVVTGIAMVFGLDENTISNVAGAVVSLASIVAYIIAEGKVDAESVKNSTEQITDNTNPIRYTNNSFSNYDNVNEGNSNGNG